MKPEAETGTAGCSSGSAGSANRSRTWSSAAARSAAPRTSKAWGWQIVDYRHRTPRLTGDYVYDQGSQAREVADLLKANESAGVDATFVFTFVQPPQEASPRERRAAGAGSVRPRYRQLRSGRVAPGRTARNDLPRDVVGTEGVVPGHR